MTPRLVAVIALATSCGSKANDAQECSAQAYDLQQFLQSSDHTPSAIHDAIDLVPRPDLPKLGASFGPVFVIHRDVTFFGTVMDAERLRFQLAEFHETEKRRGHIVFAIDATATWGLIASTVETAMSVGIDQVSFVFDRPGKVEATPPPRSSIDDELDKVMAAANASERANKMAKLLQQNVRSCPTILKVFTAMASEESSDKTGWLISALGPALVECDCNVDMPSFRSLMWRTLANAHPTNVLTVRLAAGGTPIELAASTPWREASKRFTADAKTLALRIAP